MTRPGRWLDWGLLAAILAAALWLRVRGLGFGLPAVYNMDEAAIMARALAFAKGDLNPHNFLYPTFYFYALFAWLGAYFVAGHALGSIASLDAFQTSFFVDPTGIYLAGRGLSVACGVATVWATWGLAQRLGGRVAGHVGAFLLAVAPFAVRDAHYVKHDVPVTLAIVLAMLAMSRAWPAGGSGLRPQGSEERQAHGLKTGYTEIRRSGMRPQEPEVRGSKPSSGTRSLLLASVLTGVAFSTHYYAVFLALPLALTVALASAPDGARAVVRRLVTCGLVASAVFFALSPFLLVEPMTALRDIAANRRIVVDRAGASAGALFASAPAYAGMLWREALGGPAALAVAAMGLVLLAWRARGRALLLAAFPLAFLAFISNTVAAGRYLNPVLPFLAVLVGTAAGALGRRSRVLAAVVALAGAGPAVRPSLRVGDFFRQDDTRTLAQHFIEARVKPGATVLVQPYSVPLTQSRDSLEEALKFHVGDPAKASTKFALRLRLDPYPSPAYRTLFLGDGGLDVDKIYVGYREVSGPDAVSRLQARGVQYVVLKRYNVPDPATTPLLAALERGAHRIALFSPYRPGVGPAARDAAAPFLHNTDTPIAWALERPGPVMEVWALAEPEGEATQED